MKRLSIEKETLLPHTSTKNLFQSLTRSIIFQQLSGKAAEAILKKFIALWTDKKFPKPKEVLS